MTPDRGCDSIAAMSTIVNIILGLAGAGFLLVAFLHDEWLHRDHPRFALGVLLCAAALCCFTALIMVS